MAKTMRTFQFVDWFLLELKCSINYQPLTVALGSNPAKVMLAVNGTASPPDHTSTIVTCNTGHTRGRSS